MAKLEKCIFLDFDGVLNTDSYHDDLVTNGLPAEDEFGTKFSPDAVEQLRTIVEATQAAIVISSSWRYEGLEAMQQLWKEREMPGEVVDITPLHVDDNLFSAIQLESLDDMPDHTFGIFNMRGREIQAFLNQHPEVDQYVILDDGSDILPGQRSHFLQTDPESGITAAIAQQAIEKLNS